MVVPGCVLLFKMFGLDDELINWLLSSLLGGLVMSLIMGILLLWIIKRPLSE